jgi:hypothetical protein
MNEQDTSQGNRSLELCKRVVTTESFIAEAKEIYDDRYDYSKVDYKNCEEMEQMALPFNFRYIPLDYPQPECFITQ